jgi:glycosyltransferase involved in cell wall biosynthesis
VNGRPARIAFWAGSLERAGTQRFLVELLRRLDRSRFDPLVLAVEKRGDYVAVIEEMGVPVREYGTGRLVSLTTLRCLWGASLYLRRERVDVLWPMLGKTTLFGPFVGRAAGVPVVVNGQRNLTYWFEGGIREAIYRYVNRRLVDAVLVNSEAAANELASRFHVPPERIVRIGAGVDIAAFAGAAPNRALSEDLGLDGRPLVGIVAKLSRVKGHEHFLAAAAEVARERPDARFLIVGDGPRRAQLERLSAELGLSRVVVFLGARADVSSVLKLLDVFALSSLSEGAPNAVIEAMAAGVPVVAPRVGGVPELVREGVTGTLFEPGDDRALARAIVDLLDDRARARAMGEAGAALARERYEIDGVVRRVERILAGLVEARGRRAGTARDADRPPDGATP